MFFFNDTATTEIYTLSLHDALPIWKRFAGSFGGRAPARSTTTGASTATRTRNTMKPSATSARRRSEEHTSELQSRQYLVCRLLLEKKNKDPRAGPFPHTFHPSPSSP